ncbi:MAG: flagellar assembly peptidoglycan hydrolase FlgJ [Granulosicoccus sp.]|nr:flagellar assembly peptidoglycan hydrolase FlgJ [Granulosicoccus sp.]
MIDIIQHEQALAQAASTHSETQNLARASDPSNERSVALDVAREFESLLVHNLVKAMRKSTLAENTSNARSIYDDMLDQNIANAISESGRLGIAKLIAAQLDSSDNQMQTKITGGEKNTSNNVGHPELRSLSQHIHSKASSLTEDSHAGVYPPAASHRLKHALGLWSGQSAPISERQSAFIHDLLPKAREGAKRIGTQPVVILAIAALESGWGQSMIKDVGGNNSHNLFGIKASASDDQFATSETTEYIRGKAQKLKAHFKVFHSDADAVRGFTDFLTTNPRYGNALQHAENPERFVKELQQAGYATDPNYANKLISIMRQIEQRYTPL